MLILKKTNAIMVVLKCLKLLFYIKLILKDGFMAYTHGTLENEIMNAVWTMEENGISSKDISVSEVLNEINNNGNIRAYTTIKTVMDRLVEKNLLKRQKTGKKFCYKSVESRAQMAATAINKLAGQFFNNDINSLMRALEKQCSMRV